MKEYCYRKYELPIGINADANHHDEIMDDINMAIGDVLAKLNEYQISSEMGMNGASAGGQLAMIYAHKYNDHDNINCVASIFGSTASKGWTWYNSTNICLGGSVVDILAEYAGQPWDDVVYESVSSYWNIFSNSQPTILFHGSIDPIVHVYQSQWMNGKVNSLSLAYEYHEYLAFYGYNNT